MNIITIIGARPQFIKAAVLSRYIRDNNIGITETLVHTGQHYDANMSDVFFDEMDIPRPDYNLHLGSGSHGKMTGAMLSAIEELCLEKKPDALLVYGDTNSTLAGALAASKIHIPVAHVESGLRSYMMAMPEEQNRRLTDHLATWLFCPTQTAIENLKKEGITDCKNTAKGKYPSADFKHVSMTGDIMYDASMHYASLCKKAASEVIGKEIGGFILTTIHRAENTDDISRLGNIVEAINSASDKQFVLPLHPRTRKILNANGLQFASNVTLIDPVGYFEMIALEKDCSCILTDSGGVQKEAYFFNKPCITMRDSTEWVELVDAGWNTLVGADKGKICDALRDVKTPAEHPALYGDLTCAEKICGEIRG